MSAAGVSSGTVMMDDLAERAPIYAGKFAQTIFVVECSEKNSVHNVQHSTFRPTVIQCERSTKLSQK